MALERVSRTEVSISSVSGDVPQQIGETVVEALAKKQETSMGFLALGGTEAMRATITRHPDGQTVPDD